MFGWGHDYALCDLCYGEVEASWTVEIRADDRRVVHRFSVCTPHVFDLIEDMQSAPPRTAIRLWMPADFTIRPAA